ncbi:MAG TPA: FeoA domain-containing protein [Saprospiraceae bacterium]|nr:FeoA domain-containing protein [Saprospiraceae bacterium]HRO08390.1 FeoA domain-containing protein [Saprospiraceae bacterium]HRO74214.1 FeoA domain-containing protein [Saprospiraceae bacterium]HRP41775.1 FeoA domain-containing protein [Saprospiraceae bacterium]
MSSDVDVQKPLLLLRPGRSGIVKVLIENQYAGKLLALGVLPDAVVKMVRKAPFGNVFYIKLDNHQLAIRAAEAESIIIEEII